MNFNNSSNATLKQFKKNSNDVCNNNSRTNIISGMKRRDLTTEEINECARLKAIYEARKEEARAHGLRLNQTDVAEQCGWANQSAFSQFANARIPLNLEALLKLSNVLNFDINEVSPRMGKLIGMSGEKKDNFKMEGHISPWDDSTPINDDDVEIPLIKEIELSAGVGSLNIGEYKTNKKIRFSKSTLIRQGVSYSNCVCVTVSGNSMEPEIPDKATVGIDTSKQDIIDGKIYAVVINNELTRIKQLYRLPNNRVKLRSFNRAEYEDEDLSLEDVRVVGKLFWSSVLWD